MTTFVLVHGAGHGAWCWERLTPLLAAAGHGVVAVDLPCEDPRLGCTGYAALVASAMPGDGDVVLVGHSLAGLTIPLVAAQRPVRHLVYLCALLPLPGQLPFEPDPAAPPDAAPGLETIRHDDGTFSFSPRSAATHLYNRCDPATIAWATARLRRQGRGPHRERCPLAAMPRDPATYVLTSEDRIVQPDHARWVARTRAGLEPAVLDADHSPFLSAPGPLAELLLRIAAGPR